MAALRSLDDERATMQTDLERGRRDHRRFVDNAARLEREGADPDYVARVRGQAAVARRWIDRMVANLDAS